MKNTIKLIVLLAFTLTAMGVSAQVKLGHIDAQKLISTMPETIAAQKQLEEKQADVEKELTNMQEQFQTKMNDYSKNAKTYSDVVLAAKQQEIQDMEQRIMRFQQIAVENLKKTQEELMNPIVTKAMDAIKAVGKENGFTYIYDNGALLYTAETAEDILPLVKKKLGLQ